MAIAAATVFQIQSTATASNVNGGGFNPANANMATDGAALLATGNSPTFTSVSYSFVAGDVGAWLYIKSGTNWTPGWYQIASVSLGVATLSAAIGQASIATNGVYGTNTVAGCATTASPTGATWSVDYSQSDSSPFTATDLATTTGTTNPSVVTSATVTFGVNHLGNLMQINSGTNWTSTTWYEIVSVSGGAATLDKAAGSSATLSAGTFHLGGALSLGSTDTNIFKLAQSSATASGRYFIKGGSSVTYTISGSISATTAGNNAWPIIVEGYATMRGDRPTGSTRPILAFAANSWTTANVWSLYSLQFTFSGASAIISGQSNMIAQCYLINSSSTANRSCIAATNALLTVSQCELVCHRGAAIVVTSGQPVIYDCYIHDSDVGFTSSVSGGVTLLNNIFCGMVTDAVLNTSVAWTTIYIFGNTFYGAENKLGTGLLFLTGGRNEFVYNNIFYGFSTAISHPDVNLSNFDNYNDYFNNTNDVNNATHWIKGPQDIAVNPSFTSVSQITGTTATSSGTTLTDSGKNFTTSGVVAGRDYLYVVSGTGATVGIYGITAVGTTTLTTDLTIGTSSGGNLVYQITIGRNFNVGTNLKATGYPGVFPGGLTTGYLDIGAVQRQEAGGGGSGGSFTFS